MQETKYYCDACTKETAPDLIHNINYSSNKSNKFPIGLNFECCITCFDRITSKIKSEVNLIRNKKG